MVRFLLLLLLFPSWGQAGETFSHSNLFVGSAGGSVLPFQVEVADSAERIRQGLMFRRQLLQGKGMVFLYRVESRRYFWMKNVFIPLDMLFIDASGVVREIHVAAPCQADPCPVYETKEKVRFVLEIPGGQSQSLNIRPGSRVWGPALSLPALLD